MVNYGTVTGTVHVEQSLDHADLTNYLVVTDWAPIPDDVDLDAAYKVTLAKFEVPGDTVVSRANPPAPTGTLYVRVCGHKDLTTEQLYGKLSNEVSFPFDFVPEAPVINVV